MKPRDEHPETAETLRSAIDAGRGRDKVAHSDPAAAPLGTDDEAAGTPVSAEQVRMASQHEIRADAGRAPSPTSSPHTHTNGRARPSAITLALIVGLVLLLAILLLL